MARAFLKDVCTQIGTLNYQRISSVFELLNLPSFSVNETVDLILDYLKDSTYLLPRALKDLIKITAILRTFFPTLALLVGLASSNTL